jgi:hypothetical protein
MTTLEERERKILEEVAERYRVRGYQVVERPRRSDLPMFLRGYRPDLIALSGDQKIVVEIKRKVADATAAEHLADLARVLQDRPGWRLDIVIGEGSDELAEGGKSWDYETIRRKFGIADLFLKRIPRFHDEAVTTAWAAFEAELRLIVETQGMEVKGTEPPFDLLKRAVYLGILTQQEFNFCKEYVVVRNRAAHGIMPTLTASRAKSLVQRLTKLAQRLAERHLIAAAE